MKPFVTTFAFSEDTKEIPNEHGQGSSIHIINPRNLLRLPFIPATPSFSVTVGIASVDPNLEHTFTFKILDPNRNEVLRTKDYPLQRKPHPDPSLPIESNGFYFNFNLRDVPLREAGKYLGVIYVNGEMIGEYALFVYPKGE